MGKVQDKKPWQVKITPKLFEYCYGEISKFDDVEDYIDHIMNSDLWAKERVLQDGRDEWARKVWEAYNRPIADVVEYSGLTRSAFPRYFGIPKRTFQDWLYGITKTPPHTLFMIQEILGMVTRY